MVIDYYLIQKSNLINKDIFSSEKNSAYYYSGGWHIKAIYSLMIGFIFSASTIWNESLMYLQSYAWIIGAFISSLTLYFVLKFSFVSNFLKFTPQRNFPTYHFVKIKTEESINRYFICFTLFQDLSYYLFYSCDKSLL